MQWLDGRGARLARLAGAAVMALWVASVVSSVQSLAAPGSSPCCLETGLSAGEAQWKRSGRERAISASLLTWPVLTLAGLVMGRDRRHLLVGWAGAFPLRLGLCLGAMIDCARPVQR